MKFVCEITGMTCAACSAAVERSVRKISGVTDISVSLLSGIMTVEGEFEKQRIIAAVRGAGYGASEKGKSGNVSGKYSAQLRKQLIILILSVLSALVVMYFLMGGMIGLPTPSMLTCGIVGGFFALVVMAMNYKFFVSGVMSGIHLAPNMDTLISIGSFVSFAFGTYSIVILAVSVPGTHAYETATNGLFFDSAAMILAFIDIGKFLETLGKSRAVSAIDSLARLRPQDANIEREGGETNVPIGMVAVGDTVVVRSGESLPADGAVISGNGSVNESAITGEPLPRDIIAGDGVTGGTVLESGFIKIRVTKTGEDTALAKIVALVETAAASKAPVSRIADKVSGIFVPIVLCIAIAVFGVWMGITADFAVALTYAASVLVISCPCALGLATPVAVTVGLGRAAKSGLLIKNAEALETVGKTEVMIFDKTGTITEGRPQVTEADGDLSVLARVFAVESQSSHPLAKAIVAYCETSGVERLTTDSFEQVFGGVVGSVLGDRVVVGNKAMMAREGITTAFTGMSAESDLFAAVNGEAKLRMSFADRIKPEAKETLTALKALGIKTLMLSGDSAANCEAVKRETGIDEAVSSLTPIGKEEQISALGCRTAFVGDGINDAPALTRADTGIAIGAGTDVAIDAADIVLTGGSMQGALTAVTLSRRVMRIIRQNLFWAFFYNAVCIPIAAGVFAPLSIVITPMIGSAAMSISSLFVVGNSLRLGITRPAKTKISIIAKKENQMKTIYISGMMCDNCRRHLSKALAGLGLKSEIDLTAGTAKVSGSFDEAAVRAAIEEEGYGVTAIE